DNAQAQERTASANVLAAQAAVRVARIKDNGALETDPDAVAALGQLVQRFLAAPMPVLGGPHDLAARMAALARLLRKVIELALADEDGGSSLHVQMDAFRRVLLHSLDAAEFADMYAQTIAYGLFAARCNHRGGGSFVRERAAFELPETNPFLIEMFTHIAGPRLDRRLTWAVDHLAELLNRTDIEKILEDFGRRSRREDPVVHFYETFLAAYDPALREARGVYYTPEPVVSYIVRSVDEILKDVFGLPDGLADASKISLRRTVHCAKGPERRETIGETHRVLILDPAAGTGTFLHGVIDHIYESIQRKGQAGTWSGYVSNHLLPRLFGFELLMAPYAIAHMKLGLQLAETGYEFKSGERLRIYLTNTLEEAHRVSNRDLFASIIAEEANAAAQIKSEAPVMVIVGNPPYSGHSENRSEWIAGLMRGTDSLTGQPTHNYFEVDGQPLAERNPKWLNDDYVKFIRFAQWRIEQTGYGILAFISNHGYLDNPTFRGMRRCLMETFDRIYLLDLHGNTKKKETAPDGSKDENVFDIQQGVAIGIFVKSPQGKKRATVVRHAHLYGLREVWQKDRRGERKLVGGKYFWLNNHSIKNTRWKPVAPQPPLYLFIPQERRLLAEYERGWKITDAMPVHSLGIATARDQLAVSWTKKELWHTVNIFAILSEEQARYQYNLRKDTRDWRVAAAQNDIRDSGPNKSCIIPILYRPFDQRYTYYTGRDCGFLCRPRTAVMRHMIGRDNLALSTTRGVEICRGFEHVFCSSEVIQLHTVSSKEVNYLFPLYLYPDGDLPATLFDYGNDRRPNFVLEFIEAFSQRLKMTFVPDGKGDLKKTFGPDAVFHYIYAILHSPAYRTRYAQFLRADFPRVPIPSNSSLFRQLCRSGETLTELHRMRHRLPLITRFPILGSDHVETVFYKDGRVAINATQYFDKVPPEVWAFRIGGYQVCEKWLKDRKGRILSHDEIMHYQYVVAALDETIRLMAEIDRVIAQSGNWPLE
ncbi:MAG: DNA methyltransferase, partial [Candidatus Sumerlaeia bacterium]|nr:DNA methyltransferase [Candidatus Sumerlaeia bacterium]